MSDGGEDGRDADGGASDARVADGAGRNVELKARAADLDALEGRALAAGAQAAAILHQRDTYFAASEGRLKLREERAEPADGGPAASHAELVSYVRADEATARASTYTRLPVDDPAATRAELDARLGTTGVVTKTRRLLLWRGVRIHLDDVEGLGTFVELEGVVAPGLPEDACAARVEELRHLLGIDPGAILAEGYAGLR
jgi:adenylate cyclase class IV